MINFLIVFLFGDSGLHFLIRFSLWEAPISTFLRFFLSWDSRLRFLVVFLFRDSELQNLIVFQFRRLQALDSFCLGACEFHILIDFLFLGPPSAHNLERATLSAQPPISLVFLRVL